MYSILLGVYTLLSYIALLIVSLIAPIPFFNNRFKLKARVTFKSTQAATHIWIHSASLGEAQGALSLIYRLSEHTVTPFILTVQTASAFSYLSQKQLPSSVTLSLCPLDSPRVLKKFQQTYQPCALILYEAEYWPHMLSVFNRLPIIMVSAKMRDNTFSKISICPNLMRRLLSPIDLIITQSSTDSNYFNSFHNNTQTGHDLKLLDTFPIRQSPPQVNALSVALCSMHFSEWTPLKQFLNFENNSFILLPRKLSELHSWYKAFDREQLSYSIFPDLSKPISIVTQFGRTHDVLSHCNRAIIGGSFDDIGIHNIWEPLTFGCTLYCGPYTSYQEQYVQELKELDLLTILTSDSDTNMNYRPIEDSLNHLSNVYLDKNKKTVSLIESFLLEHAVIGSSNENHPV